MEYSTKIKLEYLEENLKLIFQKIICVHEKTQKLDHFQPIVMFASMTVGEEKHSSLLFIIFLSFT